MLVVGSVTRDRYDELVKLGRDWVAMRPCRTRRADTTRTSINGRKRHLIVAQDGLLVTPADVPDRDAARILLTRLHAEHPEIVLVWSDNGYGGEEFSTWARDTLGITIKVVPRPKDAKGFVLLPKR